MNCWKCGTELTSPYLGKMPFRASCDACGSSLHCCNNCIYYKPGLPNDCQVPNTEYVRDRTASNLCEDFKVAGKKPQKMIDPNDIAKRLFKD